MSTVPRSADMLRDIILNTPALKQELMKNPEAILPQLAKQVTKDLPTPALVADSWIYRLVVIALGTVCIVAMFGAIYLHSNIPETITALGSAAIGALAGILAPSPLNRQQ